MNINEGQDIGKGKMTKEEILKGLDLPLCIVENLMKDL